MSSIPFLSVLSSIQNGSPPTPILELESRLFHTNFKLDADGDSIYLSDPSGTTIDSFIYSMQLPDDSYGRVPGDMQDWWLFDSPTPGSANTSHAYAGYVEDLPHFSKEGGYFANLTYLTLTSDNPDDTIYYTMDGTNPDKDATIYKQRIEINAESVVSARILRGNYIPGKVASHTFYNKDHHGLPIIAITTDPDNFFDRDYGIYVKGPNAETSFPYFGSNFWNDWERPVNLTMYDADTIAFSVGAGVKIFGGWSRGHDQKSLSIFVRSIYGDRNINYPIFKDRPFKKYEALVLRNSGNDWFGITNLTDIQNGSMIRDIMMTSLTKNMNIERQASRQAVLYINGEYWGIHNIREKVNEHYLASNFDIDPDRIHLLQNNQEVIIGSNAHYANLINFVSSNNLETASNYDYVKKQMDIQDFINYELAEIYFDNRDWPGNNIKYWRPDYENGKWRWIMYDTDFGFGMWDKNKVNFNTLAFALDPNQTGWPNPAWSTLLLRKLVTNQDFLKLFVNSFADQMNTSFLPDTVNNLINFLRFNIDDEMFNHVDRWGGIYQNWINTINDLYFFANNRSTAVRSHLISKFNLGTIYSLNLEISEKGAGVIALNTIMVRDFPWSGLYFKNVPVTVTAIPEPGFVFTGWTGTVNSSSPNIEIDLNSATTITANFAIDPNPDPMRMIINEICYNSDSINSTADWIELYNKSDQYVDLSDWMIKDGNNAHVYRIKQGSVVKPNGYYIICKNKYKFSSIHADLEVIEGNLKFGLSSDGDIVRLFNDRDELVNLVSYGISTPWPVIEDGSGYTLSLLNPSLDNFPASSWRISDEQLGTPGKRNFGPGVGIEPPLEGQENILFQNFPNPFNESTRILIYSDTFQQIRISVYDLNGRLVDVIAKGEVDKGYHEYNWTPATVGPGFYILRFETPWTVRILSMMKVL